MQNINQAESILSQYEQRHLDPPDPRPFFCECCLQEIREGDRMWKINGSILCDACAKDRYSQEVEDY